MNAARVSGSTKAALSFLLAGCLMGPVAAMAQSPGAASDTTHTPADTASVAPAVVAPAVTTPPPAATPPPTATSATPPPTAQSAAYANEDAGMFSKGKKRVSVVAGYASSFGNDYLLLGVGVGYFLANGLDVGVDFEGWLLGDPSLYKLSPRIDYVMWRMARIKPYAGAFYRYNFVGGGHSDLSSVGGRAGLFYKGYRGGMAGAGGVWERYLDCENKGYSADNCNVFYPEIFVAMSF